MSIAQYAAHLRRKNRAWVRRHSYSFFSSLGVLLHHKVGTLMTVLVIGIAMFLPLGLYTTLANLEGMDLRQEEWSAVTVFFKTGTKNGTDLVFGIEGEHLIFSQPVKITSIVKHYHNGQDIHLFVKHE